jgi:hypothetical protein
MHATLLLCINKIHLYYITGGGACQGARRCTTIAFGPRQVSIATSGGNAASDAPRTGLQAFYVGFPPPICEGPPLVCEGLVLGRAGLAARPEVRRRESGGADGSLICDNPARWIHHMSRIKCVAGTTTTWTPAGSPPVRCGTQPPPYTPMRHSVLCSEVRRSILSWSRNTRRHR